MDEGFVVVGISTRKDPDGSRLRAFLRTQIALERAQSFRDLFVHLLAVASLPLGVFAAMSPGERTGFRSFVVAGWLTCTVALVFTGACEFRYRRRCAALKRDLGPPP